MILRRLYRRRSTRGWECGRDFHLASPASPADFSRIPLEIASLNSQGTRNVLELARYHDAKYLVASTSEAYGDPLVHPQDEGYRGNVSTTGPRACYDEGKRFGESITSVDVNIYGVDGRVVRIFNTYGARMNPQDGRSVPNFITQALRGEPLTVYGAGKQTRSYCYVSDMVAGLMAVMFAPMETRGMVFNLGNPDEREILAFAEIIRDLCGSGSRIEYMPALRDDPRDGARILRVLGGCWGGSRRLRWKRGLERRLRGSERRWLVRSLLMPR